MPVGHVLVRDPRGHVEHDDTTLALDVISVSESTKLLLTGRVPHIECQVAKVSVEFKGMNFDTKRRYRKRENQSSFFRSMRPNGKTKKNREGAQAPKHASLGVRAKRERRLTDVFLFELASQMTLSMDEKISSVV